MNPLAQDILDVMQSIRTLQPGIDADALARAAMAHFDPSMVPPPPEIGRAIEEDFQRIMECICDEHPGEIITADWLAEAVMAEHQAMGLHHYFAHSAHMSAVRMASCVIEGREWDDS